PVQPSLPSVRSTIVVGLTFLVQYTRANSKDSQARPVTEAVGHLPVSYFAAAPLRRTRIASAIAASVSKSATASTSAVRAAAQCGGSPPTRCATVSATIEITVPPTKQTSPCRPTVATHVSRLNTRSSQPRRVARYTSQAIAKKFNIRTSDAL